MFYLAPSKKFVSVSIAQIMIYFLRAWLISEGVTLQSWMNFGHKIINATKCSEPFDLCYLQECKICPGSNVITFHILKLQDIKGTEEITYALWDNGNLIKKNSANYCF